MTRTSNGATVVTVADLWERTVGGATTHFSCFGADIIGVRRSDQGTRHLFSDHLGSVSAATNASGALVGMQHYDPWGRVRTGGIGLTARNFTGQRLDATGLLYYHARYYDPTLGRFISPDSIVPGAGAPTAAPHDAGVWPAWAQDGSAPTTPQALNRYAYAQNAPLRCTDPTGHCVEPITLTLCAVTATAFVLAAGSLIAVQASGTAVHGGPVAVPPSLAEQADPCSAMCCATRSRIKRLTLPLPRRQQRRSRQTRYRTCSAAPNRFVGGIRIGTIPDQTPLRRNSNASPSPAACATIPMFLAGRLAQCLGWHDWSAPSLEPDWNTCDRSAQRSRIASQGQGEMADTILRRTYHGSAHRRGVSPDRLSGVAPSLCLR